MTTRGRLSLVRRTLLSSWRRWGIRMSLWSCMIEMDGIILSFLYLFEQQFHPQLVLWI